MASTPLQLATKLGNVAKDISKADKDPVLLAKAGRAMAEPLSRAATSAGATSFAGKPLPGWRVTVRGDTAFVRPSNSGAMVAHNDGTTAHWIANKRTRRGAGKRVMAGPGFGPVSGRVLHPGTRGRNFVRRASQLGIEAAGEVVRKDLRYRVDRHL